MQISLLVSRRLSCLSIFLGFCRIFRFPNTPKIPLLDKDDHRVNVKYEKSSYSYDVMKRIVENLRYLKYQQIV